MQGAKGKRQKAFFVILINCSPHTIHCTPITSYDSRFTICPHRSLLTFISHSIHLLTFFCPLSLFVIRHSLFLIEFKTKLSPDITSTSLFRFRFSLFAFHFSLFTSSRIGSLRSLIRRWGAVNPFKACAALDFFVLYAPLKRAWQINKNVK